MSQFDSSVVSQAVTQLEIVCTKIAKSPQNKGLIAFKAVSPGSQFAQLSRENIESLRPISEILPFSGDFRRRLGSISTACEVRQSFFAFSATT
jgi:hypothetical protein